MNSYSGRVSTDSIGRDGENPITIEVAIGHSVEISVSGSIARTLESDRIFRMKRNYAGICILAWIIHEPVGKMQLCVGLGGRSLSE
ncbi:MAG: hypothetical protein SWY16_21830 [Cyanobacteriota bacterium]|nr:hypothetical protein [Cyanobacteriota bacterium]